MSKETKIKVQSNAAELFITRLPKRTKPHEAALVAYTADRKMIRFSVNLQYEAQEHVSHKIL